jgi:hypothetical protein
MWLWPCGVMHATQGVGESYMQLQPWGVLHVALVMSVMHVAWAAL